MQEAESLNLIAEKGIEGDFYLGSPDRQVLLLDKSTLDEFGYKPGELREQILVEFDGLQSLGAGSILTVGGAKVEVTMNCAPCLHMAETLGEPGQEFVQKLMGRRGMLGVVVESGSVKAGDTVAAEVPAEA